MSLLQKPATTCADCFHPKENHVDGVCNGSLTCMCPKYVEPILFEFAQLVEKEKADRKSINKRVRWILETIPKTRNAGEKTFYKIYIEIWYGFKIRKEGTKMTSEDWKRLPNQDTVNREKRRCKHNDESLKTYDPQVIQKQNVIFQALMELTS